MGNAANNGAGTCVNSPSPSNCKMALSVLHQKDLVLIQEFILKWLTCSFLEYQTNKLPHIHKQIWIVTGREKCASCRI